MMADMAAHHASGKLPPAGKPPKRVQVLLKDNSRVAVGPGPDTASTPPGLDSIDMKSGP